MSTRHELDRSISAWLVAESQENAPDRLLAISRERIRRTPQRKPWWPAREIGQLGTKAKFNLVAGAVVAIAIIAANLLPVGGSPSVGAPAPTESPPPSPSASSQADIWETGPYDVGRHEATLDGISFTFDTPSEGWFSQDWTGMLETGTYPNVDYAWIGFRWVYDDPATDPCIGDTKSVGPSVDDLATAMSTIPGTEALEPIDARVGGLLAKVVEFTINDDIPCDPGSFWLYGPGSVYPNSLASRIKIWIFEVDGHRTGIHSDQVGSNPALEAEIQEIVDSVQFE